MTDPMRFEFDADGHLILAGYDDWREPICADCGRPIAWVLGAFSFSQLRNGKHLLLHAECAWTPHGLRRMAKRALLDAATPQEDAAPSEWAKVHLALDALDAQRYATPKENDHD